MQSGVLRATDLEKRVFESVPTGIAELDAVIGGLPRGAITEIYGPPSSGRTSAIMSILAESTAREESCALIDGNDAFDPKSAAAAGVDLKRLLWVRCHELDHVMKSTDLLLQGGGFGCVVMDMNDLPAAQVRAVPLATWFRFQRTIENTPAILLVTGRHNLVKSAAALVLRFEITNSNWSGLLEDIEIDVEVIRARRSNPQFEFRKSKSLSHVRLHFRSQFSI